MPSSSSASLVRTFGNRPANVLHFLCSSSRRQRNEHVARINSIAIGTNSRMSCAIHRLPTLPTTSSTSSSNPPSVGSCFCSRSSPCSTCTSSRKSIGRRLSPGYVIRPASATRRRNRRSKTARSSDGYLRLAGSAACRCDRWETFRINCRRDTARADYLERRTMMANAGRKYRY